MLHTNTHNWINREKNKKKETERMRKREEGKSGGTKYKQLVYLGKGSLGDSY